VKVAFASRNRGKLFELRVLLPRWELEPLDPEGLEETGSSFRENARLKAQLAHERRRGSWALGEDSGVEVDGLGGEPGIRSARYAGEDASDAENLELLLRELRDTDGADRRGRYVCEMVLISPTGEEHCARGTLEGEIAVAASGSAGFGYDPVFIPEGENRTVGELGEAWKTAHSHRARAVRALLDALSSSGSVTFVSGSQALVDLAELNQQIRLAVLVDADGSVTATPGVEPAQAAAVAVASRALLAAAEEAVGQDQARERIVQIQAALPEGSAFVVRDEERVLAAVTRADVTVGLVFYDLKTCLRHLAGENLAPKPAARAGSKKAALDGQG
jgi:XTP/dITP diphosphohydrolase